MFGIVTVFLHLIIAGEVSWLLAKHTSEQCRSQPSSGNLMSEHPPYRLDLSPCFMHVVAEPLKQSWKRKLFKLKSVASSRVFTDSVRVSTDWLEMAHMLLLIFPLNVWSQKCSITSKLTTKESL